VISRTLTAVALVGAALSLAATPPSDRGFAPKARTWVQRYDGSAHGVDEGHALQVSPDGERIYVTGVGQELDTSDDYVTTAYDAATGDRLWVSRYDDPDSGPDLVRALAVSPDGSRIYVTGESYQGADPPLTFDYATVAYDAFTGSELWVSRYNGRHDNDHAYGVAVSPDGSRVFVTGESLDHSLNDLTTIAYDAASGLQLWVDRYDGPGDGQDTGNDIVVSLDGSLVYVTGDSRGFATSDDAIVVAYNSATGARRWIGRYDSGYQGDDGGSAITLSPDGTRLFVAGHAGGANLLADCLTLAYDAGTGTELWSATSDGPVSGFDALADVATSGDQVFVSGGISSESSSDMVTFAYDASTGTQLWIVTYNGPGNSFDGGTAVEVSPDGRRVFVAGYASSIGESWNYVTFVLRGSSGRQLWVGTYDGPGHGLDVATSIGSNSDGTRWYVTGHSDGGETIRDWATVAYAP
jgi:PQQ-like domain